MGTGSWFSFKFFPCIIWSDYGWAVIQYTDIDSIASALRHGIRNVPLCRPKTAFCLDWDISRRHSHAAKQQSVFRASAEVRSICSWQLLLPFMAITFIWLACVRTSVSSFISALVNQGSESVSSSIGVLSLCIRLASFPLRHYAASFGRSPSHIGTQFWHYQYQLPILYPLGQEQSNTCCSSVSISAQAEQRGITHPLLQALLGLTCNICPSSWPHTAHMQKSDWKPYLVEDILDFDLLVSISYSATLGSAVHRRLPFNRLWPLRVKTVGM